MNEAQALEALAKALADKVRSEKPARPKLRLVVTAKPTKFDAITRDCIMRRVRYLTKAYQLQWLVDQETFDTPGVDALEDGDLADLLRTLERARDCIAEGVGFEDAGLVRSIADDIPDLDPA